MARKIRPPKQVTDELDAQQIVADARHSSCALDLAKRIRRLAEREATR